ncbi:hypothetical protein ACF08E_18595 [Streptomyces globisporus]|uniref:hypothetical protein n=1 Tax=Streptomyces globisporus TaxID=1908 RepID=UPI003701DA0E
MSRTISGVHQSPTTSSAWATEQSASARLVRWGVVVLRLWPLPEPVRRCVDQRAGAAPPLGAALYAAAPALLRPVRALLAVAARGAARAARRLPGPGERARAAGKGPHAETGSPERAPAG